MRSAQGRMPLVTGERAVAAARKLALFNVFTKDQALLRHASCDSEETPAHFSHVVVSIFREVLADPAYTSLERDLDVVKLWSGVGTIWSAAAKRGLAAKPFDKNREPLETMMSEDILSMVPSQRPLVC